MKELILVRECWDCGYRLRLWKFKSYGGYWDYFTTIHYT